MSTNNNAADKYDSFLNKHGKEILVIYKQALALRKKTIQETIKNKHCDNDDEALMGKCIEVSDTLVEILTKQGYKCKAYQCFCLYEEYESCSDYCYEEHWVVVIEIASTRVYIDPTISQFQWAFNKKLPAVYVGFTLPGFLLNKEPGRDTLSRCGWTLWYENGDYDNSGFDYYKHLRHPGNIKMINYLKQQLSK